MKKLIWVIYGTLLYHNIVNSTILYVPTEYLTITMAIDNSSLGDTVLIEDGIYHEQLRIRSSLTISSAFIFNNDSSYVNTTILTGFQIPGPTGSLIIIEPSDSIATFRIIGLSFRDSNVGQNSDNPDNWGYGGIIQCHGDSINLPHIYISDNIFENNFSTLGGAIFLDNVDAIIQNNLFLNNFSIRFGGGLHINKGNYYIENNQFLNNSVQYFQGAGIFSYYTDELELIENVFKENIAYLSYGGGIAIVRCTRSVVSENLFLSNVSGGGGGLAIEYGDSSFIENNKFIDNDSGTNPNRVGDASALFVWANAGYSKVSRNIFAINNGRDRNGAISLSSNIDFHNNIVTGNTGRLCGAVTTTAWNNMFHTVNISYNIFYDNIPSQYTRPSDIYYGAATSSIQTHLELHNNDFYLNERYAFGLHQPTHGSVNAENNFWGDPSGPYHEILNPNGTGDTVMTEVETILPFSTEPWTPWRIPTAPELLQPEDGSPLPDEGLLFIWRSATDANLDDSLFYQVELDTTPEFTEPRSFDAGTDTSLFIEGLSPGHSWFWRVFVRDDTWLFRRSDTRFLQAQSSVETKDKVSPSRFMLRRVWPNPFNSSLSIAYDLPRSGNVTFIFHNILGKLVEKRLIENQTEGSHFFSLDCRKWSNGIYFIHGQSEYGIETRKIVLIK